MWYRLIGAYTISKGGGEGKRGGKVVTVATATGFCPVGEDESDDGDGDGAAVLEPEAEAEWYRKRRVAPACLTTSCGVSLMETTAL